MMKRLTLALLAGALSLAVSAEGVYGPSRAESTVNTSKSNTFKTMTGKVIQVNPAAKTFTVSSNGRQVTLHGENLKSLPKVDEVIDISYNESPTGPAAMSIQLNSSRSNSY